jgi:hypothetical protein
MNKFLLFVLAFVVLSKYTPTDPDQSFLGLNEIQQLLEEVDQKLAGLSFNEDTVLMSMSKSEEIEEEDEEEIKTGDELGIRAGGEPPLKTGEAPRNTIVASTKMRFKIPDMNA